MSPLIIVVGGLVAAVLSLVVAGVRAARIGTSDAGDESMKDLADKIRLGADVFLMTQYKILTIFVGVVAVLLFVFIDEMAILNGTAIAFVLGAFASGLAGFVGMRTATTSNVRTTAAARDGLAGALDVAFASGTVMGLSVVGLAVLGLSGLYFWKNGVATTGLEVEPIFGFSFGASAIALFARVGGGIFTKAADVGADIVGKVEAGIPEDDPRNPAVIADNVGDNVGDVAGMGADLFESYVGSIIATMAIGLTGHMAGIGAVDLETISGAETFPFGDATAILLPLALAAAGIVASLVGMLFVGTDDETKLTDTLFHGLIAASVTFALLALGLVWFFDVAIAGTWWSWGIYVAVIAGLVVGVLIGLVTEWYTSEQDPPTQEIARQSRTGTATNIIYGLAVGMESTGYPVLLICGGVFFAYNFAGLYGVALSAVGMLSTLGISLGIDAFGPVADNAGGIAEMSGQDPEVRERTDSLDAAGNTTAAIGKGFAIGSAALTALALFNAYSQELVKTSHEESLSLLTRMDINDPNVVIGLFVGGMLVFVFASLAMKAVGGAANEMITEVQRQFEKMPGILEGTEEPDYTRCVAISTKAALRQMVVPGVLAVLAPVLVGLGLGVTGLGGLLAGALVTGVLFAIFMANAGGAWDNAKKYIEAGELEGEGKGSDAHKAAVVGDTVGDPFKDTAGPSLNILIKLMAIVSLVFAPVFVSYGLNEMEAEAGARGGETAATAPADPDPSGAGSSEEAE